jgi:hypothetical protein
MTKQEILKSNDFSGKLTLPRGYELYTIYTGGDRLHYYFFTPDNKLLFSGKDYRPSPLYKSIDCVESVIDCLSFLCLQDGATDREYFKDYTPEQLAFRDSPECEEMNMLIWDAEEMNRTDPDEQARHIEAMEYFNSHYTQLID